MNASGTAAQPEAPPAWRVAGLLATLAGLALVALVIAYWGWKWFGPVPIHVPRAAPGDPASELVAAPPFGRASAPSLPATAGVRPEVASGDSKLLGVFAEPGGKGYALLRLANGSTRLVAAGGAIDATTTLVAVRPDGITLRDAGGERSIVLRRTEEARTASASPSAAAARTGACAVPAGFTGQVVRLNAELVQGLIAQPDSWRNLVEARQGGLMIREDGSFAAMLGLKRGDRVEQANGIALASPDDVAGAVLRPLIDNQSVRIAGTRNGERRELLLQNAGRCPG